MWWGLWRFWGWGRCFCCEEELRRRTLLPLGRVFPRVHYCDHNHFILSINKIDSKRKASGPNAPDGFVDGFVVLRTPAYLFKRFFNTQQEIVAEVAAAGFVVSKSFLDVGLGFFSDEKNFVQFMGSRFWLSRLPMVRPTHRQPPVPPDVNQAAPPALAKERLVPAFGS